MTMNYDNVLEKKGRQWVLNEYSIEQLVERHNKIYETVQGSKSKQFKT